MLTGKISSVLDKYRDGGGGRGSRHLMDNVVSNTIRQQQQFHRLPPDTDHSSSAVHHSLLGCSVHSISAAAVVVDVDRAAAAASGTNDVSSSCDAVAIGMSPVHAVSHRLGWGGEFDENKVQ
jgi:hypothetical protein